MSERLLKLFLDSSGVSIDTRSLKVGELFFALKGPNFDGNVYAKKAIDLGAKAVVADDPDLRDVDNIYVVESALLALQNLARDYRRTLHCPLLALTGSNGKTTTKELITSVLAQSYRVASTQGNLNNHIGVPLTLLNIPTEAEIAVVEMGANHQGEIAALARIAEPTHGLITNIGRAHLEGFGGLEGVRKGKSELFRYLKSSNACAFVDMANEEVRALAELVERKLWYSSAGESVLPEEEVLLTATLTQAYPCIQGDLTARGNFQKFESHLPGAHNYSNLIAAAAIGHYFKVPLHKIAEAFASYRPDNSRSELRSFGESSLLLDAYNANPDSTLAGLNWLASREEKQKVAVLGTLNELGAFAKTSHFEVAKAAEHIEGIEIAYFGSTWSEVQEKRPVFTELPELHVWLSRYLGQAETAILIKGSRSNKLERLVEPN